MKQLEEVTNVSLDGKEFAFLLAGVSFAVAGVTADPATKFTTMLAFADATQDLGRDRIEALSKRLHGLMDDNYGEHYQDIDIGALMDDDAPEPESASAPAKEVA